MAKPWDGADGGTRAARGRAEGAALHMRNLLEDVVRRAASDLHLVPGERPKLRIDGEIAEADSVGTLSADEALQLAYSVVTEEQRRGFEAGDELDFSFGLPGLARFRGNLYRERGRAAMAVRMIPLDVPALELLDLPPVIASLADRPRGLVLVTGPTGSGKSTTLAAMIDKVNRERRGHILTVEDPIEFIHSNQGCIVTQREVGADTASFATALRYALRQDPDVILIGELRDAETIGAALTVAETGHLALATLHTGSAAESVNRLIDVFPSHQQRQVRAQLASVLEGVVTQILIPRAQGTGRLVAAEVMVCTPAIRALIRDDRVHQIYSAMQAGKQHGMQTMNDALHQLHMRGEVALEECLKRSAEPGELLRMVGEPVHAP